MHSSLGSSTLRLFSLQLRFQSSAWGHRKTGPHGQPTTRERGLATSPDGTRPNKFACYKTSHTTPRVICACRVPHALPQGERLSLGPPSRRCLGQTGAAMATKIVVRDELIGEAVARQGGYEAVENNKKWEAIANGLGLPKLPCLALLCWQAISICPWLARPASSLTH